MNKDELEEYKQSLPPGVREDMKIGGQTEDHVTNSIALGGLYGVSRAALPAIAGWYNKGRLPSESTMPWKDLWKRSWDQRQFTGSRPGQGVWNPVRGMPGYGTVKKLITGKPNPGGFGSGPDAAFRQAVERVGVPTGAGLILHNLVNKYKPKKRK